MIYVSTLHILLGHLCVTADLDDCWEDFQERDPNCEEDQKDVIREWVLPHVADYEGETIMDLIQDCLQYYLNKWSHRCWTEEDLYEIRDPFDRTMNIWVLPDDPMLFYLWCWETLFPEMPFEDESILAEKKSYERPDCSNGSSQLRGLIVCTEA